MDHTQDTCDSMIDALTSGNSEEFEKGYRRFCILYHENIRRWCQRWFESEQDADDTAHDLLVALHRKLKKYQPLKGVPFRNWLSKVSKHMSMDVIRKRTRDRKRYVNISIDDQLGETDFMGELFIDFERRDLISKALTTAQGRISDRKQHVLKNYLEDIPTVETAVELSSTQNNIHQTMFQIRKELKQEITSILSKRGLVEADLFAD